MAETQETRVEDWTLDHTFEDTEGKQINCGREDCTLGSYVVAKEALSTQYSPACKTCEFAGGCGDVFNADEPRFEPGAPEDFKRGAARVMINGTHSPMWAIRMGRPDTAQMIDDYASMIDNYVSLTPED